MHCGESAFLQSGEGALHTSTKIDIMKKILSFEDII